MNIFGRGAALGAAIVVVGLSAAPAGAVAARGSQDGTPVVSTAATAKQKPIRCKAANRTVTVVAKASKSIVGQSYGVEATRTVSLCTTRKNRTTVYSSTLSLKGVSGSLAKVKVGSGDTKRSTLLGVTSLTTPLTAQAHWLFSTYHVVGTLVTTIDRYGKVTSQVVEVKRV